MVKMAVAMKIAEPKIAAQLGICQNTLRKHFSEELEFGRLRKTMENLMRLDKAAKGGNVSAMKYIDAKIAAANRASDEGDHVPPKGEKMGKKEQAARDAETAGQDTEWGDDLMPPTMSVN
ncbi:hypothetical protein BCL74_2074 [Oceanibaculum indicum]|uniref:Uncharacterized protein n=1 Tax=Oceanibaculum indicum TaxID=526216 RepID=A0A420WGI6_9PROT|nr:hypothetical protein BCL74_2074 [Oceanibaculum indicum]